MAGSTMGSSCVLSGRGDATSLRGSTDDALEIFAAIGASVCSASAGGALRPDVSMLST